MDAGRYSTAEKWHSHVGLQWFCDVDGWHAGGHVQCDVASTFNLGGGSGADVFDIDATLTGSVTGGAGSDTLQGTTIDAVVITGSTANGFGGTESDVTGNFSEISVLTGNGGSLTGGNTANTWTLDGTPQLSNGTHTLDFSGFATLTGGTLADTFNV